MNDEKNLAGLFVNSVQACSMFNAWFVALTRSIFVFFFVLHRSGLVWSRWWTRRPTRRRGSSGGSEHRSCGLAGGQ